MKTMSRMVVEYAESINRSIDSADRSSFGEREQKGLIPDFTIGSGGSSSPKGAEPPAGPVSGQQDLYGSDA